MIKATETQEDVCAQKSLGPWLVVISLLVVVTVILAFYFADDIRKGRENRGQMQIGKFKVPVHMGQQGGKTAAVKPTAFTPPWRSQQNPDAITGATPQKVSFNQAIGIASPSVVGIKTSGGQQQSASGIIVHSRGYVLTNNHVVKNADNIVVTLSCGQAVKSYPAQIFDSRDDLDLAIIKINKTGNEVFSPARLGDSDNIYIGQQVVAIGNPFGLTQSASSGIISNPDRTLTTGTKTFNNLIQTDASINPGSSGSALISTNGEVIGINTAIYSSTQSFSGISFAVPINQAKMAFPDLIETAQSPLYNGNVPGISANGGMKIRMMAAQGQGLGLRQGQGQGLGLGLRQGQGPAKLECWLGIHVYPIDSTAAKKMRLPMPYGVIINRVFKDSPAANAGLKRKDVILRVNSKRIRDENMLWSVLEGKKAGSEVKISVFRNGRKEVFTAILQPKQSRVGTSLSNAGAATMGSNRSLPSPRQQNAAGKKLIEGHWLGLEVIPLTAELATEYQIPNGETGILVDEITLESAESGILAGDMVQSIGGFATPDLEAFFSVTRRERVWEAKSTQVQISRRGSKMTFTLTSRNAKILGFAQMEAAQPIQPGALRPHRYMGSCTSCHIFMKTGGQLAIDAGDILPDPPPITENAKAAHRYRGNCATCHTIMKTGGQSAAGLGNIFPNPPTITRGAKAPHRYRGDCATCHTIR